ncbi:MAG: hypothetical protein NVSMB4_08670 [Acidimicrobiales bacterium]
MGEIMLAFGGVAVVEEHLHGFVLGAPRADGVIVDRWTCWERDARSSLECR